MFAILLSLLLSTASVNVNVSSNVSATNEATIRTRVRVNNREVREGFKERLQEMKDERKKKIVERIDSRLSNFNERWTVRANNVLSRLSRILGKASTRADKLEARGVDVSEVRRLITAAEAAINEAQGVVTNQAAKEYIIDIGDEENIGETVRALVQQFKADIRTMMDSVKDARAAVVRVIRQLKSSNE